MTTTTLPARQAAATRPARLESQQVPYRGLFREAQYEDGQPYAVEPDDALDSGADQ